jgi:hypothetical protein
MAIFFDSVSAVVINAVSMRKSDKSHRALPS